MSPLWKLYAGLLYAAYVVIGYRVVILCTISYHKRLFRAYGYKCGPLSRTEHGISLLNAFLAWPVIAVIGWWMNHDLGPE